MNSTTQNESAGTPPNGAAPSGLDSSAEETTQNKREFSSVVRSAVGVADEYVHRSPWLCVGIAAVAGAAVGVLLSRSRKDVDA